MIKKREMKFWTTLNQNLVHNSSLDNLLKKASDIRLPYIIYYENLITKYGSAMKCESMLQKEFINISNQ